MEQPAGTEEWGVRQRSGRGRAEGLARGGQDSGARCGTGVGGQRLRMEGWSGGSGRSQTWGMVGGGSGIGVKPQPVTGGGAGPARGSF